MLQLWDNSERSAIVCSLDTSLALFKLFSSNSSGSTLALQLSLLSRSGLAIEILTTFV